MYGGVNLLRFNFYLSTALRRIDEVGGGSFYVDILFLSLPLIGGLTSLTVVTVDIRNFGINGVSRVATILGLSYGCLVLAASLKNRCSSSSRDIDNVHAYVDYRLHNSNLIIAK